MGSSDEIKLENWIAYKRDIASLLRNRVINKNEYFLYLHLRLNCNPYGICSTNINAIRSDIFSNVSTNYITKLLLSLKSKRLVWFARRQGSRSSFELHFGDFILPTKKISSLDSLFDNDLVRTKNPDETQRESELRVEDVGPSQMLESTRKAIFKVKNTSLAPNPVRSNNTNNENNINNDKIVSFVSTKPTKSYIPYSFEEEQCKKMAIGLGEDDITFILNAYQKYGLEQVIWAYSLTMESKEVNHKGKYFNKLISEQEKDRKNG